MHVILHRVDERGRASEVLQDNGHVAMERVANRIAQQRRAMFGAENEVNVQTGEGLGHGMGRPLSGLERCGIHLPRALPWAGAEAETRLWRFASPA